MKKGADLIENKKIFTVGLFCIVIYLRLAMSEEMMHQPNHRFCYTMACLDGMLNVFTDPESNYKISALHGVLI